MFEMSFLSCNWGNALAKEGKKDPQKKKKVVNIYIKKSSVFFRSVFLMFFFYRVAISNIYTNAFQYKKKKKMMRTKERGGNSRAALLTQNGLIKFKWEAAIDSFFLRYARVPWLYMLCVKIKKGLFSKIEKLKLNDIELNPNDVFRSPPPVYIYIYMYIRCMPVQPHNHVCSKISSLKPTHLPTHLPYLVIVVLFRVPYVYLSLYSKPHSY